MKKRWGRKVLLGLLIIVIALTAAWEVYVNDYYHANETALAAISDPAAGITVEQEKDALIFLPSAENSIEDGLIFYPGGKVDYRAYAPLMSLLAEQGMTCILVKMPCNLAFLNLNAADGIPEQYSEITDWYIGGHSLGGVAAAMYLKKHASGYKGLILMASYSSTDLSDTNLAVLSMYGENDGVLGMDSYEEAKKNLPQNFTEYVIPGGCHAYYGDYGEQKGDGEAAITPQEQQQAATEAIMEWIKTGE